MNLDQQIHVRSRCLPDHPYRLNRLFFSVPGNVRSPWPGKRVELQGREATGNDLHGTFGVILGRFGTPRPAVGINANPVAAGAAQQVIHRCPVMLSGDVPKRLLQAAEGAVEIHGAAFAREVMVGHEGKVLDIGRVATNKVAAQLLHMCHNTQVAVRLGVAFTPAADAGVGVDLYKQPILPGTRIDQEMVHRRNMHDLVSPVVQSRSMP